MTLHHSILQHSLIKIFACYMNLKYGYLKMNEQELDQLCPNSFNLKSSEHRGDGGEEVTLRCACSCLKNQAA